MKRILFLLFGSLALSGYGQKVVTGKVTDRNGNPLQGANVIVKGTYNGVSTDSIGSYSLKIDNFNAILIATYIGYQPQEQQVGNEGVVNFRLKESSNSIGSVVITAGTYETSDRKRSVTLQPLDIVTTPSATGDIYGALTTLPGSITKPEDGRLFVRGGDGYESKTFIDGLLVQKPYSSNIPDMGSRGRFSPQLFSGTIFSTGGYSAEYGQALSSALILNTNAFPQRTQTEISVMTLGGGVTQTLKFQKFAMSVGVEYFNLQPYMSLSGNRYKLTRSPEVFSGLITSQVKLGNSSTLKVLSHFSSSAVGMEYPDFSTPTSLVDIRLRNLNGYYNASYTGMITRNTILKGGVALTHDDNNINAQVFNVMEKNRNVQAKAMAKSNIMGSFSVSMGLEETYNYFKQDYNETNTSFSNTSKFDDYNTALFAETELRPFAKLAIRVGGRAEYCSVLQEGFISPRLSAALKLTDAGMVSLAYGQFFQTPEEPLLRFSHNLKPEQANHFILNYQWEKNDRILRIETYFKQYRKLVTYDASCFWDGDLYGNGGMGYSQGVDLFWRDRITFRRLEYWLAYSYIDSKRKYRDYPSEVTPPFAPRHSASIVAKYWVQSITTLFGFSSTVSSGRPYNNPNSPNFMDGLTPYFADVSINASHLRQIFGKQAIIYFAVNNLSGRDNIFGYRFFSQPNSDGTYEAFPIRANNPRFIMAALFITL